MTFYDKLDVLYSLEDNDKMEELQSAFIALFEDSTIEQQNELYRLSYTYFFGAEFCMFFFEYLSTQ
tara:strand:+ start:441 stop:638 length:198 start_codon:yes stop_codon:yes gene_type:complete